MIICSKCKKILENKNLTVREEKICIDCVRGSAPAADLTKLMPMNGHDHSNDQPKMTLNDYKRFIKKCTNMTLEHKYVEVDGKIHVCFMILDYYKNPFMEFAFNKKHLRDFISDINNIENEEEVKL